MRHKGDIWGVYVKPEWRGRGIARQMLAAILDRLRSYPTLDHVLLHVSDSQARARRLYESLGFETCGHERRAHKIGDDYVDQYHMVLFLKA
jgi:ribosomal protein S18 acetylase RimI-like enzyme